MKQLTIDNQRYDLLKQQFTDSPYGNGNGHNDHSVATLEDLEQPIAKGAEQIAVENAVYTILENIGEDPQRQGLERTPTRVAKAFAELTSGYHLSLIHI